MSSRFKHFLPRFFFCPLIAIFFASLFFLVLFSSPHFLMLSPMETKKHHSGLLSLWTSSSTYDESDGANDINIAVVAAANVMCQHDSATSTATTMTATHTTNDFLCTSLFTQKKIALFQRKNNKQSIAKKASASATQTTSIASIGELVFCLSLLLTHLFLVSRYFWFCSTLWRLLWLRFFCSALLPFPFCSFFFFSVARYLLVRSYFI